MCELDVQLTRDGAVVVIHDETVDRTTDGRGRVAAMTLDEIKRLDAGMRFGAISRASGFPTLDEVLGAQRRGRSCGLNIEIKEARSSAGLRADSRASARSDTAMVSSFEWEALEDRGCAIDPRSHGAARRERSGRAARGGRAMHAYAINPRFDIADGGFCVEAHRARPRGLGLDSR